MASLEEEISRIISINPSDLKHIEGNIKENIIYQIKSTFVKDNPRALWLNFKYKATTIGYDTEYPYLKIPDLVSENELYYLMVDDFNENFHLLSGDINGIMFFIGECEGLDEYYLISFDFKKLICENDHDELLYIDINEQIPLYSASL